ncbi:hypothetical protein HMPREF0577_2193 [Mobiluncus mulieris ATCC 35243]|nr:hypothetical protein HMPREF0577_2193 [Mobiluncus mulieris ATCC 35243]
MPIFLHTTRPLVAFWRWLHEVLSGLFTVTRDTALLLNKIVLPTEIGEVLGVRPQYTEPPPHLPKLLSDIPLPLKLLATGT